MNDSSTLPKLLVLGSLLPGSKDGGGVVKDEVLKRYPKDKYVCFAVGRGNESGDVEIAESIRGIPCSTGRLVPDIQLRGARFYRPFLRALGYLAIAPWRVNQIVSFAKEHSVELIWAELQYDALIIAEAVSKKSGIPFVGTVWDDPEGWFSDRGYDLFSRWLVRRRFTNALRTARHLSTAGEAMQIAYERKFGVKSVILRHGFEKPAVWSEPKQRNEIIIGYVGSVYGRDTWKAFLPIVAQMNRTGNYPQIGFRIFGAGHFPFQQEGIRIEIRGWQPVEVMLKEIAECDFCYLTYWFEQKKRRHVELSFPNKFETYVAAGRPVLYHGPDYAGIARTIEEYGVGLCVNSLEERGIAAKLEKMIGDTSLRASFSAAATAAFQTEFNADVMLRNFAALIEGGYNASL